MPMWRRAPMVAAVVAALGLCGCVERVLQVRTAPEGADVYLNGTKIGTTPLDHDFAFYGTVSVLLRKDGYRSRHVVKELVVPWYETFPLDFFAENVVPITLRDEHAIDVSLEEIPPARRLDPAALERDADIASRKAQRLREEIHRAVKGTAPPAPTRREKSETPSQTKPNGR
ncbi:MAG: PEGA domain-containing protein [Planctomycetota bacterium]